MGGGFNAAVMNGQTNLWGDPLMFFEPESEHSAATVCEGFAVAGGRVTNFTSGQGLVLMKEVLYTISGKRLPVRDEHRRPRPDQPGPERPRRARRRDGVADCGWGMMFARNAQEAGDFCLIARRAAEATQTPFFNVQDGFLTTHTVETVRLPEPEFMKEYIGDPKEKLDQPDGPGQPDDVRRGPEPGFVHEGEDRPALVLRPHRPSPGRGVRPSLPARPAGKYGFVEPYRCDDADYILVGMGCYMETAKATVDYLRDEKGIAAGCLTVFVFRPFPARADRRGPQGLQGVHRLRAHGRPAVDHRQPSDPRDQGGLLRRRDRAERAGADRPRAADLSAAPPAWAAATSVPATSSPPSTT